jgi:hypothetical protein
LELYVPLYAIVPLIQLIAVINVWPESGEPEDEIVLLKVTEDRSKSRIVTFDEVISFDNLSSSFKAGKEHIRCLLDAYRSPYFALNLGLAVTLLLIGHPCL